MITFRIARRHSSARHAALVLSRSFISIHIKSSDRLRGQVRNKREALAFILRHQRVISGYIEYDIESSGISRDPFPAGDAR